VVPFWKVVFI